MTASDNHVESPRTDVPVLIVGAGPTGLVLALWLTRLGVAVRIIDKTAEPGTTSRALAVSARTLELYQQLGMAGAACRGRRQGSGGQLLGPGPQGRTAAIGTSGRGFDAVPLRINLPARRSRASADRTARRTWE